MPENKTQSSAAKTFEAIGRFVTKVPGIEPLIELQHKEKTTKEEYALAAIEAVAQHLAPTLTRYVGGMENFFTKTGEGHRNEFKLPYIIAASAVDVLGMIGMTTSGRDYIPVRLLFNAVINGLYDLVPQLRDQLRK